ncbi:MAG: hypothetical protein WBB39_04930 [Candidatus Saccharimonadales bacterium]|nr:hypothetical protein [Candidatus Saccharibacteria bacterium]
MDPVYEYDGQMYENVEDFLQALAHEYTHGDAENVVDTLEQYGFTLSDINVRPEGV